MTAQRGIHLQYGFEAHEKGQRGAEIENPLFDLLAAMQAGGSIRQAAQALGQSYRHVWGALRHWEGVLGEELVHWGQGRRAQLTPYAQRLLWAERQARTRLTPHIEALRAELLNVLAQAGDARLQVLEVFASHDLALPHVQALASRAQALHVSLRFAGSTECLRALNDGRCTVAGFHVPRLHEQQGSPVFAAALKPLLQPGRHKLIGSHARRQGLMLRKTLPAGQIGRVADLAGSTLRFVNRQAGSGTRLLMDHLLHEAGIAPGEITGYTTRSEDTHVAVAAAIASGAADVGPGVEAAAREFGLDFVPLIDEDYYLVCLKEQLDTPGLTQLREVLASPSWSEALSALPGYAPQRAGEVLSLTRALPWWRFRAVK
jgi:putative molybdopterin biosynthesis protein